jgi:peptidoglycan hydrolase-like protein with peptidoglycan-binding domain
VVSENDSNKQEERRGFAGLASMVSDVETEVASSLMHANTEPSPLSQGATQTGDQLQQPQSKPKTHRRATQLSGVSSIGKWLFGIVALMGITWFVYQSGNHRTSGPAYTSGLSSSSVTPAPTPASPSTPRQIPPRPTVQPQVTNRLNEDKPLVGKNNVLTTAQIRYCLAEKIRLDASEAGVNKYVDSEVERFNGYVGDYNGRCGEFRYRQGELESARVDVEPYRDQLEAEGRNRFVRSPTAASRAAAPAQATQLTRLSPDATVQAIQIRLSELGYDVGTADGLPGGKTRAAILAFQRDNGISADGNASQALLKKMLVGNARVPNKNSRKLSEPEQRSLEAACSTEKYSNGEAAYRTCLDRQTSALMAGVRRPDLSALSNAESQSIEAACSTDKYVNGPAAYNKCLTNQLKSLQGQSGRPDLSRLSSSELQSIEAACSTDKYVNGPAAYNNCLNTQLRVLDRQGSRPDLSRLSQSERQSIEAACSTDKYVNGPAAYNLCLTRQLARFRN